MKLIEVSVLVFAATFAFAHEANVHLGKPIEGEVMNVQGDYLTLRIPSGTAAVTLLDETKIERDSQAGRRADLALGYTWQCSGQSSRRARWSRRKSSFTRDGTSRHRRAGRHDGAQAEHVA